MSRPELIPRVAPRGFPKRVNPILSTTDAHSSATDNSLGDQNNASKFSHIQTSLVTYFFEHLLRV